MGSVKDKVDKVMKKVADKIMPKEVAKVAPYIAMAAPFLGPVGMLASLPAQALADAKNYGKLNYKKLLEDFWNGFKPHLNKMSELEREKILEALEKELADLFFPKNEEKRCHQHC